MGVHSPLDRSEFCCLCAHACSSTALLLWCRLCSQGRPGFFVFFLIGWLAVLGHVSVFFLISGGSDLTNSVFPAVSRRTRSRRRQEAAARAGSLARRSPSSAMCVCTVVAAFSRRFARRPTCTRIQNLVHIPHVLSTPHPISGVISHCSHLLRHSSAT